MNYLQRLETRASPSTGTRSSHPRPRGHPSPRPAPHPAVWCVRFTRFCLDKLKQTPQAAGTAAITPYLDHLALEERVSPATRKQAFNAIVFLTRKVFGIEDFTIDQPVPATGGNRRPPVVMTRDEVRSVLAHLDGVWKIAALIMYGSGLRLMECLTLRVKDLDFGQGTITIHDGLESGTDIRTVQDLLGHASVKTTMIYIHVMKRPGAGAPSPLDLAF